MNRRPRLIWAIVVNTFVYVSYYGMLICLYGLLVWHISALATKLLGFDPKKDGYWETMLGVMGLFSAFACTPIKDFLLDKNAGVLGRIVRWTNKRMEDEGGFTTDERRMCEIATIKLSQGILKLVQRKTLTGEKVANVLRRFVLKRFSTESYGFCKVLGDVVPILPFNVSHEEYVRVRNLLGEWIEKAVAKTCKSAGDLDSVFAVYFLESLICKKLYEWNKADPAKQQELIEYMLDRVGTNGKCGALASFPLFHHCASLVYKRIPKKLSMALENDKAALEMLAQKGIDNCACKISFPSTVTRMMKSGIRVTNSDLQLARQYVDDCIKFNGEYSKYHYVKAELLYLSVCHRYAEDAVHKLLEAYSASCIADKLVLNESRQHIYEEKGQGYQNLKICIEAELNKLGTVISCPIKICVESASRCNKRLLDDAQGQDVLKPNEDVCIVDSEHNIYIVMDGVTRRHIEYDHTGRSAALDVADIAARSISQYLLENSSCPDKLELLRMAAGMANKEIFKYRSQKREVDWGYYPGAVGIVVLIVGDMLYYLSMGDCAGMLLRSNSRISFGRQLALDALYLQHKSKVERYRRYCNHPEEKWAYALFNGDANAVSLAETGSLTLKVNDVIVLFSDGVEKYMAFENVSKLASIDPQQMLEESAPYDIEPFGRYADDKTIIKLRVIPQFAYTIRMETEK